MTRKTSSNSDPAEFHTDSTKLQARSSEQRLLEIAQTLPGQSILSMSLGRAQAAESLAVSRPDAKVHCWFIDSHHAALATEHAQSLNNLTISCMEEWPDQVADLAMLPLHVTGESELSRDLLQTAYQRLQTGGMLIASVDNPKDRWLHDQMKTFDKSVKVRTFEDAVVYFVIKEHPLKRTRDFSCEFTFRDLDKIIRLVTRPGVFSHRELDNGARQLLDAVDVYPGARLLEIGCGSGAVSLGLAARDPSATIHAIDSNARAVWCTKRGAELNSLDNVTVELNHTGCYGEPARFDMALGNPPYYADFRIAELFIEAAVRSLRPEGRLVMVTKQPKWYEENLSRWLEDAEVFPSRRYHIVSGIKPSI